MIAKLSGILDSVSQNFLILDVGGVGYMVFASPRTLTRVGISGDPVSLLIDTQIREDAFNLYGFFDSAEQEWFRLLTSVQGVGAKAAMAILGVVPPDQLGFAIASGDAAMIRRADGVGPKLATRIVTELKDKAGKIDLKPNRSGKTMINKTAAEDHDMTVDHDAVSALVNLGYTRSEAYRAVLAVKSKSNDNSKIDDIIKMALKELVS
ncbi:MAG: Holliday junction branch migration protein RuvA [Alphaproteobacteria bacterium CG_4_9_14_3_um_filter_47_13]|nr:MAG: Holliday junction branch migration protein RuvA [Alphaproteobacteria bacterium CG_4_9_14_3_um_filter_47_13]